ncbi:HTH-type transcriptional repressor DasR [Paenibacillus solanacearum]|uniref:HTH-type transcriptional repressor DasR n=1 Tax=Paenibacillus solanacearum TaxID=2048548 RepID=A0A916K7Z1_9BACL|nr:GntR family transcriptional regulator [Paenibacillus solanacearum]CAG7648071.1 HTH-type transcriptional repressor DasR [Paenibacillus solanacearum]
MKLSRRNKPLYLQIKNIIKDRILHGVYPLGMYIPSEPELEAEFSVSKITVRNAIKELAQEGYLEKSSGKGTTVIRNTSASKLSKWKRFTEVLVEEGRQIQKQLLQAKVVTNEEGTEPHRLFGERCLLIERIYRLDGKPYIYYTHYLTPLLEEIELADLNQQSLYGLIEEHDISLEKFRDEFAVATAPAHVEEILGVPGGTALLQRFRYSYDDRGEVIEYSTGFYNTRMGHYSIHYDA